MEKFEELYRKLNIKQKEAVDAIEGPVMVIAGPGTGKTTILTLRIANILKRTDTPPSGILAITYTDAGVKAMRAKLHDIIGNRAHEVRIHTFHSFAAAVIAEYPDHFLSLDGMKQMTEIDQESLVRDILTDPVFAELRPPGRPDAYLAAVLRTIDDAKREALTPALVRQYSKDEVERIKNDESSISSRGATKGQMKAEAREEIAKCERTLLFADVYERYDDRKRDDRSMDFNDLIIELLVALRNDELLLRLLQERYLYISVDEHQDTNDAQNFIIRYIAEFFETPNIFIVGDEKQAIYRFQGASVENFLLLEKHWPTMRKISLDTNYRSHQKILDASFGMIEHNYEAEEHRELRVKLSAGGSTASRPLDVVTGENTAATEAYLVSELQAIAARESQATVAIIVRRNRDLDRVIRLLEANHIPVASERSVDIFNHPIGAVFFDLLDYLADPSQYESLGRTLAAGMWDLSLEKAGELMKLLRSGQDIRLEKHLPALVRIRASLLSDGPVGFLVHAADQSGFTALVTRDPSYVHVWRGIIALAESLAREGMIGMPAELISRMLAYRRSAEERTVKIAVGAPEAPFRAMTAHGSKGLEFDYVFIPYATEEAWVGKPRGSSFVLPRKQAAFSDINDLRRLFYVALTRARRHAAILVPLEESDGRTLSPLRFISELGEDQIKTALLERAESVPLSPGRIRQPAVSLTLINLAKRTLVERGLSVTALNHFLRCPSEFLYQSILRMPQAPSVPAEKGNAMHAALSHVWKIPKRTVEPITRSLEESITEYLKGSFLPLAEKEALKKELLTNAPIVAKALEAHFSQTGSVFTEHWIETSFEGSYEGAPIRLPLHGKLDALLDDGNTVSVFDYKTRQAMSVAAIKGETKNSDGDYFRQLVFYAILLSGESRWRTRRTGVALVFVTPDEKGRCPVISLPVSDTDIAFVRSKIQELIEAVWSGAFLEKRCTDQRCTWCGLKSLTLH